VIGATADPARDITKLCAYTPARTNASCPGNNDDNAFCTDRHGNANVPGFESDPDPDT
jgi:hypothetical protein